MEPVVVFVVLFLVTIVVALILGILLDIEQQAIAAGPAVLTLAQCIKA
jgi:hypothetical protein